MYCISVEEIEALEKDDQYAKGEDLLFEADRILEEQPPVKGDDDTNAQDNRIT